MTSTARGPAKAHRQRTVQAAPTLRRLRPGDARSLAACFQRCYGASYPNDIFHDVAALAARIESGLLRSVVATHGGEVVGHTGYSLRHPDALAAEAGNTVVDPAFRGQGLLVELGAALHALGIEQGFVGYNHYPTTAHGIMQGASVQQGGVETGVMLAYIPAETDYLAVDTRPGGRLAATIAYQPLGRAPARSLFLPAAYEGLIRGRTSLPRDWKAPHAAAGAPAIETTLHARRGLLHIDVLQSGPGLADRVRSAIDASPAAIVHVDLPLDDPGSDDAIAALRPLGFFFCGWLPECRHCDVLRMQRIAAPAPADWAPELVNEGARTLLAYMHTEAGRHSPLAGELGG